MLIRSFRWLDMWQQYAHKLLYRSMLEGVLLSSWDGSQWQELDLDGAAEVGPFGQAIWLVAAKDTLFRTCSFPVDIVSRDYIDEAVQLDVSQWVPWGDSTSIYYRPVHNGDAWDISVWAWDGAKLNQELGLLPDSGSSITHIIPEDVWMSASAGAHAWRMSLAVYRSADGYRYLAIDQAGYIRSVAWVKKLRDARFFFQNLGSDAEQIEMITLHDGVSVSDLPWLPEGETIAEGVNSPSQALIERGRLPGRVDWRDPMAWKPLFSALAMLAVVWVMGSSMLVWSKQQIVDEGLAQAKEGGEEVLQTRAVVDALAFKLSAVALLDQQQKLPVLLLYELSGHLPKDVWLQSIHLRPQMLEIIGQGKGAAALAGLLEKMPHVERASYIGDIRPVPNSEQQYFSIALYLKADES